MGDERTNEVFIDDVFVPDDYVVGELRQAASSTSPQALDLERFTMFTFSPIEQRLELLSDYVRTEERDGEPLRDDPVIRQRIAQLATQAEVARVPRPAASSTPSVEGREGRGRTAADRRGVGVQALRDRVLAPRSPNASMDLGGAGRQLRVHTEDAPMEGRAGVDLPLHGDRHDRRWRLRDPEEHHRAPRARPAEELLTVTGPALLDGITVLDLATVGPAARTSRWLADYGATVVKVGADAQAGRRADHPALLRVRRAPRHAARAQST